MGIDTPAFASGVERPQDTAAERGQLFTTNFQLGVSAGGTQIGQFGTNTSGSAQFLQFVSVAQAFTATRPVQTDVGLKFSVLNSGGGPTFTVRDTGGALVTNPPAFAIEPGGELEVTVTNGGSSFVQVVANITIREE